MVFVLSSALHATECFGDVAYCEGRLDFRVFNLEGSPITEFKATLLTGRSSRTVTSGQSVLYGDYLLRIEAPGFRSATQPIHVDAPETLLRFELEIGTIAGVHRASILRGQIQKLPANQEIWAKAVPLRGPGSTESRVYGSGYFELRGLRRGSYILLLTSGDRVLHQQIVLSQEPGRDSPIVTILLPP